MASFIFPIDGDCLNSRDGEIRDSVLYINVKVSAESGRRISVNQITLEDNDGIYSGLVPLGEGKNLLTLSENREAGASVLVHNFTPTEKKYRISVDDNILFLRDITKNKDIYTSIFDNPYLAMYKKAHELYSACVQLNLFYETDDMPRFYDKGEYFNLSMMTDKFKDEFEKNSSWLRLSFHARAEHPDKPYINASAEEIYADAARVNCEIIRFAGRKALSSTTTVHYGEATEDGTIALRRLGYSTLAGYFEISKKGVPSVAYYYDNDLIRHVGARDFWRNNKTGILHSRIDLVLNTISYDVLFDKLEAIYADPHRSGFIELMIHEQYFYPEYKNYIPLFSSLVLDAARWVHEHGYTGTFIEDMKIDLTE